MTISEIKKIKVLQSYQQAHVLLTGPTGFLCKVLFTMMLDQLPGIAKIYLLIRKKNESSAMDRFMQQVLSSAVLIPMREKLKDGFNQFIAEKVRIIEGDIDLPQLGITDAQLSYLHANLDLVINAAGLIDFFPEVNKAIATNIDGTLAVAEFVRKCKKAALLHISTCYVAGIKNGIINESVDLYHSPNNKSFDPEQELDFVKNEIARIQQENKEKDSESIKKLLCRLGNERRTYWGWTNTYCYTKAIAEMLLVKHYQDIQLSIIRPSIIESAVSFPFPGWIEGLHSSVAVAYMVGRYPYILGKQDGVVDMVPVDYVCTAILLIGAASINKQNDLVYQIASSEVNPFYWPKVVKWTTQWYRDHHKHLGQTWIPYYYFVLKRIKLISPDYIFSPKNLLRIVTWCETNLARLNKIKLLTPVVKKLEQLKFGIKQLNKIYNIFCPFTHDNAYVFIANHIKYLIPEEEAWTYRQSQLNNKKYWIDIHMTGAGYWIFPLYQNKQVTIKLPPVLLADTEKTLILSLS